LSCEPFNFESRIERLGSSARNSTFFWAIFLGNDGNELGRNSFVHSKVSMALQTAGR
jgi:hypothetical protein